MQIELVGVSSSLVLSTKFTFSVPQMWRHLKTLLLRSILLTLGSDLLWWTKDRPLLLCPLILIPPFSSSLLSLMILLGILVLLGHWIPEFSLLILMSFVSWIPLLNTPSLERELSQSIMIMNTSQPLTLLMSWIMLCCGWKFPRFGSTLVRLLLPL